jgi:hypothetical protein
MREQRDWTSDSRIDTQEVEEVRMLALDSMLQRSSAVDNVLCTLKIEGTSK